MRLVLAIPDLLNHHRDALSAAPALAALAQYAARPALGTHGIAGALLHLSGLPVESPPAPVAALGAGLDVAGRYVMYADPVTLVAGRDNVTLAGRRDDLAQAESAALVATLNRHFASDGLVFCAPRADAWFVSVPGAPALTTTPLARVRGPLYPYLPKGNDGHTWRRWLSEMQMLLHDHPVNIAREAAALMPVTGIWISGGGTLPPPPQRGYPIFAAAGSAGDVARGIAFLAGQIPAGLPTTLVADRHAHDLVAILDAVRDQAAIAATDRAWLAPAVAALARGDVSHLTVIADGNGYAATWQATRPSLAARVRARLRARPFVPPPHPDVDDVA